MQSLGTMFSALNRISSKKLEKFEDAWNVNGLLGNGTFGCVFEVTHKTTHKVQAVKLIVTKTATEREAALEESSIWQRIGEHKHVVRLHEIYEEQDKLFLVMEKCGCNILKRQSKVGLQMKDFVSLFQQMLSAIAHLHSQNIVHRDVKFENFLCVGKNFECVKLCDFGFAALVPSGSHLTGVFGTPPYISPEMLVASHDLKTDVWSIGVCCYFLLSRGKFPYAPVDNAASLSNKAIAMKRAISEGAQISPEVDDLRHAPSAGKLFTITLLNRNAKERLTAEKALEHPFLHKDCCVAPLARVQSTDTQSTIASEGDIEEAVTVEESQGRRMRDNSLISL